MLREICVSAVIASALFMPPTETLAAGAAGSHGRYRVGNYRSYDAGYHEGYQRGFRRGYDNGASHRHGSNGIATSPVAAFGAVLLGATYGYWSDGYRTYGGDPCYVYNGRDWDWEKVC